MQMHRQSLSTYGAPLCETIVGEQCADARLLVAAGTAGLDQIGAAVDTTGGEHEPDEDGAHDKSHSTRRASMVRPARR